MSINTKKILAFLLIISSFCFCSCDKFGSRRSVKPKAGFFAPDFTLTSIDGTEYKLSDLKGKVVFVNFWATWCPPCKEEIPSMVQLYNKLKSEDFVILAISVDSDVEAVKKFIKSYHISFPVLMDTEKKIYNLYMATGVPETHLVNKEGIIENTSIGPFNWMEKSVVSSVKELINR